MARWKPVPLGIGEPPRDNQRIDGDIWTYSQPTNTIGKWSYPTRHESQRFNSVNTMVRGFDQTYAGLSELSHEFWESFWQLPWWVIVCLQLNEYLEALPPDDIGVASFRAVNLARADQGYGTILLPPVDVYVPGDESLGITTRFLLPGENPNLSCGVVVTWDAGSSPTITTAAVSFYGRATNTLPPLFSQRRKNRYIGSIVMESGVPYDITALIGSAPFWFFGGCEIFNMRVGSPGSIPRSMWEFQITAGGNAGPIG